jgi:hypothetical protein
MDTDATHVKTTAARYKSAVIEAKNAYFRADGLSSTALLNKGEARADALAAALSVEELEKVEAAFKVIEAHAQRVVDAVFNTPDDKNDLRAALGGIKVDGSTTLSELLEGYFALRSGNDDPDMDDGVPENYSAEVDAALGALAGGISALAERPVPAGRGADLRAALERLDRVRQTCERDKEPVPHWVVVEVCAAVNDELAKKLRDPQQ